MLDIPSLSLLLQTGLEEKQARVYLALLQLGTATATQVAHTAELKRSITYVILDELMSRGYASIVPGDRSKNRYAAVDPNALLSTLERTTQDFREMLPYLRAMQRKAGKPYVTYYEGVKSTHLSLMQIRKPKEARYAVSIAQARQHIPDEVKRWEKIYRSGKAGKEGRHLLVDEAEGRSFANLLRTAGQEVRFASGETGLPSDIALADGVVHIVTFDEEVHTTEIYSEALYVSLCALFDLAWQSARE